MKVHTNEFKNAIKQYGKELDSIVTYELNGETIELGNSMLNSITPHFEGAILKSVMKQLDIDSNVEIPKGTILNYKFGVKVKNDDVENYRDNYEYLNFGNYIVDKVEKQEDNDSYLLTCYDKMLYSMVEYEPPYVDVEKTTKITYPITIRNYINAICNHLGLTFKNESNTFANYNQEIQTELYATYNESIQKWQSSYTFRDVLDEIAQVTASTICINEDTDELEIRYISDSGDTINEEYLDSVNVAFGEQYGPINTIVLSRSGGSDKVYKSYPDDLPDDEKNAIEIADNQIMNFNDRSNYLPDILNKLNGLQYYLNDFSSKGICYYNLCDRYNIQIGEMIYSCVMFNDEINVTQGLAEIVYAEMPEESETDYTKADKTDRKINQTYLIVDKQNQQIESVISNVDDQNSKISTITQKVDELTSQISDIADITTSGESTFATFDLDNINASEPIMIKIHPTVSNISYLYPRNNLYPSDTQYLPNRKIRFKNKTTNENIDYELPDDLLYYDSNTYDEFYLDYESQTCQVTKRCGYNADGSIYKLASEKIITYNEYPTINLTDGNYTISLLGYEYGYIFTKLMSKNIYTTQFYTKVETDSHITQKADEIELGVNQTLTNYSTTAEMNSAITLKANEINSTVSTKVEKNEIISQINQTPETISINANKVNLTGYITATDLSGTSTTINGENIKTGTISTDRLSSKVITTDNFRAQNINASQITAGTITARAINNTNFRVTTNGVITAISGTVGGWSLSNNRLYAVTGGYTISLYPNKVVATNNSTGVETQATWFQIINAGINYDN